MNDAPESHGSSNKGSVVERIETLSCDAAWRNYYFLKITTADGWDDEIVTVAPNYVDGHLVLGDAPGGAPGAPRTYSSS